MTGAGSGELVFGLESNGLGSDIEDGNTDGDPDLYSVGRNPTLTELDLSNQLARLRDAISVEAVESMAQNLDGAIGIEATISTDTHDKVEEWVFNDGGDGFVPGRANSATVYTGVDYLDGSIDRELNGVIPLEYAINWEQGGLLTYTLTCGYQDDGNASTLSLTDVTRPTDGTTVPFHGADFQVSGASVQKLQSATLSISGIARFHFGTPRKPVDAVIADPQSTLDITAIISGPDRLEQAYGSSGATSIEDSLESVTGSLALDVDGTPVSTYDLPKLKPDSLSWQEVISTEDTTESVSYHVNGGVTVS